MVARGQPGVLPSSADTSGCAMTATTTLTGTRISTVQVSRAAEVCRTCARPAAPSSSLTAGPVLASTGPASTGTTTAVRAPPATMS